MHHMLYRKYINLRHLLTLCTRFVRSVISLKRLYRAFHNVLRDYTNIYNKKTKGPTLMELFTATGKLKTFFDN
jgi:hypothetical protein